VEDLAIVPRRRRRRRSLWPIASYTVLGGLAVFSLGPILILIFNSLKTDAELGRNPLGFPTHPVFENYPEAWSTGGMSTGLRNSLVLVVATVIGVCVISGLAAYALARLNLIGQHAVLFYLVVGSTIPAVLFIVPLFHLWTRLHLYDTLLGLIVIYCAVEAPFTTLLLRSYFLALPKEFEEAARVDGANELQVLVKVVLPLSWPGFLTVALVAGLAAWNEFFFAVTFIQTNSKMPVVTTFLNFIHGFRRDWGLTGAAAVLIVLPVIVLFMLLQRRFIEGLTSSGLKG
jgi:raffinose/stachyose/melibiose transport system permease protein